MPVCTSSKISSAPLRVAQLAQPAQVALRRDVHAALALHRLDDERRRVVVDRALGGDEVAEGHDHGLGQQRAIRVAVLGLADHRERAERAAVERVLGRDELAPPGGAVRELERALDRLGAGVREEAARDRLGREPGQRLGEVELRQRVEQVGGLHQAAGLLADRVHQRGVAVPDRAAAPAGGEVDVLAPVDVHHARAAALGERDRQPVHDGQEEGRFAALHVIEAHVVPSLGCASLRAGRHPACHVAGCARREALGKSRRVEASAHAVKRRAVSSAV